MPAVGPGTSIGGRYHLRQRLERTDRVERWEADDTTFGRRVVVTVLDADDPAAEAALDAARRASALTDPRLLPILDAGREGDLVHVVEAEVQGSTLTELLRDGGLPAPEARRIVLEVAEVLDRARGRGLHHLALTPDDVLRGRDGSVRLRGLAVQAALLGRDGDSDQAASRTDALGLAALLHAATTATWPGKDATSLQATPVVAGAPAPPSELVAAVPDDIEDLVRRALGRARGTDGRPQDPGAVADALRPATLLAPSPGPTDTSDRFPADPPTSDPSAGDRSGPVTAATSDTSGTTSPADAASSSGVASTAGVMGSVGGAGAATGSTPHRLADDLRKDVEHVPSRAEAAAIAAAGATAAGAKAAARRVGDLVDGASRRAEDRRRERETRRLETQPARVPLSTLADERPRRAEPVAPIFVNDVPTGTPSRRQANFVLALLAALVVLGLVLGVVGVMSMVNNIQRQLDAPPVGRTYTVTAPAVTITKGADGTVTTKPAAPTRAPGAPIAVVGVTAYDPEGQDHAENNDTVGNVHDGDTATYWRSQRYKTDTFGNLKSGVGLAVYLGDAHSDVSQIKLTLPNSAGEDLTVYGSDTPTKDGAAVLGTAKGAKGEVTITVPAGQGKRPYIVVWFTNSPRMFGGNYAALSEISLS